MPTKVRLPNGARRQLETEPLSEEAFSTFGTVIANPAPSLTPSKNLTTVPPNAVQANQGSALKYLDVTVMKDFYGISPSTQASKAVMNMFVCAPRELISTPDPTIEGLFPIQILERHPFTTQTFIPLGVSPQEAHRARYLVVVAPSLPPSPNDEDLPVPSQAPEVQPTGRLPGRGLPDLNRIRAFMANGSQAVTYGAGTWHAPMVVVGEKPIDFVVVQFANGVGNEDCQEVDWKNDEDDRGLSVAVPAVAINALERTRGLERL